MNPYDENYNEDEKVIVFYILWWSTPVVSPWKRKQVLPNNVFYLDFTDCSLKSLKEINNVGLDLIAC